MEIIDPEQKNQNTPNQFWREQEKSHKRSKVFTGFIILSVGVLFLLKELGMNIPHWLISWPMLLIVIGLSIWIKNPIRHFFGGFILVVIGTLFLTKSILPALIIGKFVWPLVIILIGLYVLFKPSGSFRRKQNCHNYKHTRRWQRWEQQWKAQAEFNKNDYSPENYIEVNSIFGGVKKKIISKNFRGGEVNAVFGGAEINLSQADIQGRVELEVNQVFGGTKLIIPPHWEIHSELDAVFGSVEDKRPILKDEFSDQSKVLVLQGAAVFGGIEIHSY
ncbi:MAG: cell wall-active antibiotics response protein [Bacteroidia bacterium]|nr:cell wall-active antibiotics response protein [Bacteroidia bacterium]